MKKVIVLLSVLVITLSMSCNKGAALVKHRGVVLHAICGDIIVQSVGTEAIGQTDWADKNVSGDPVVHHVFRVANPCTADIMNTADTFNFIIVEKQAQNCVLCMAALPYMPDSVLSIQRVN